MKISIFAQVEEPAVTEPFAAEAAKEESVLEIEEKVVVESVVEEETAVIETQEEFMEDDAQVAAEKVEETVSKADKKESMARAEEKGRAFLSKIFEEMKLDVVIDVRENNGYLVFDLQGKNLGILIGRRGDTLDSLQFLLNLVINEKNNAKVKGIIDIENYRAKREETLIGLGHKLAAKARKTGQKVVLEPMNPQERRIIHMALQNDKRVTTYSEGEEPYRKVVIEPLEEAPKNYYKKNYKKNYHKKDKETV